MAQEKDVYVRFYVDTPYTKALSLLQAEESPLTFTESLDYVALFKAKNALFSNPFTLQITDWHKLNEDLMHRSVLESLKFSPSCFLAYPGANISRPVVEDVRAMSLFLGKREVSHYMIATVDILQPRFVHGVNVWKNLHLSRTMDCFTTPHN